jgi:hypothetical protein
VGRGKLCGRTTLYIRIILIAAAVGCAIAALGQLRRWRRNRKFAMKLDQFCSENIDEKKQRE